MKMYSANLFKEFPSHIPNIVETYSSDKITILKAQNVFSEPKGFGCYKFLIPAKNMPVAVVEKKKFHLEQKKIFPINPDQVHLFTEEKSVETFIPIFIETNYMKEFSHVLSGKSEISFNNGTFSIDTQISQLVLQFMEEAENRQVGYEFILQSLNTQITVSLLRCVSHNTSSHSSPKEYSDLKVIKKSDEFFRNHLCSDFSLHELANYVNYSPYHFIRIFKKHTGKTPFEYLTELKIEKAKKLISTNAYTISEVSVSCGFSNRTHFATVFKRIVGMTPSKYKELAVCKNTGQTLLE